ncbi:flagellar protein, partial [Rhizobium ruizarguesonis]
FNEDGSTDGDLMSEDQISLVSSAYALASSTIASTETGEAYDTYFAAEIGNITSVDQLMSYDKLVGYLRIAYGLSDDGSDRSFMS